ncbi:MAG: alpha-amylase [Oscillospiraceae bacterium]|nr:alpha-amylase [Oscillospiraceae bacterium]
MAQSTPKNYRKHIMYSVYLRNHTPEGTFQALRRDLLRIRNLGTDILWLMPIHPIGQKARKGTLGSPYAISDYRQVNPEYGTMEDFKALVKDIHSLGMKCIIDVVYNHTSPDSWLAANHPEWFYHKSDGSFGNHVGDWSDIVDLDYTQAALWDYQIETLKMWAEIVDGFRCDVAPLLPIEFWNRARAEVAKVRPDCFWLSESIEPGFIEYLHSQNLIAHTDGEIFEAFDVAYDYDIWGIFRGYLEGKQPLSAYAEAVNRQEAIYPDNYVKLRYLENHDNDRAAQIIPDRRQRRNWTAFLYFQRGMTLLYGGQEMGAAHRPGLFDRDTVQWNTGEDDTDFLTRLAKLKKEHVPTEGSYHVQALPEDVLLASYDCDGKKLVGIFCVGGTVARTDLPDGCYRDLIAGGNVNICSGVADTGGTPVWFFL